jgi:hypothetical protein
MTTDPERTDERSDVEVPEGPELRGARTRKRSRPAPPMIDIGLVLRNTFRVFGRGALPLTAFALLCYGPWLGLEAAGVGSVDATPQSFLLYLFAATFGGFINSTAVIVFTFEQLQGRRIGLGGALGRAAPMMPALFVSNIIVAIALGFGFLILIVPGVIFFVCSCVSSPALLNERLGPIRAIDRSFALTRGSRLVILLLGFLMVMVQVLLSVPAALLETGLLADKEQGVVLGVRILSALFTVLSGTLFAVCITALYHDLRRIRADLGESLESIFD